MQESKLFQILSRLYAMKQDRSANQQIRRFEQFGIELCRISFDHETNIYHLIEYKPYHEFDFDDMDLAAIEIYECLVDMQLTF